MFYVPRRKMGGKRESVRPSADDGDNGLAHDRTFADTPAMARGRTGGMDTARSCAKLSSGQPAESTAAARAVEKLHNRQAISRKATPCQVCRTQFMSPSGNRALHMGEWCGAVATVAGQRHSIGG